MALYIHDSAANDPALYLCNIVLIASNAQTGRLLASKQALYLEISCSSSKDYEKLKLFHFRPDDGTWKSPRGPIPIAMSELVPLNFIVLENVVQPLASRSVTLDALRENSGAMSASETDNDGYRTTLTFADRDGGEMRLSFDIFRRWPLSYEKDTPFPLDDYPYDAVLEARLGPIIPPTVMNMERKKPSEILHGLDDPLEYLHCLTSLVMEAKQVYDILEASHSAHDNIMSFMRRYAEETAFIAVRDLSLDAHYRWEESLHRIPPGHRLQPSYLLQVITVIHKLQEADNVADFDYCISFFLGTEFHQAGKLSVGLSTVWRRHVDHVIKKEQNSSDLDVAISITQRLLDSGGVLGFRPTPDLACLLIHRYDQTLEQSDLERARELLQEPPVKDDETEYYGFRCMLAARTGVCDVEAAAAHAALCATNPAFSRLCAEQNPMGAVLLLMQRFVAGGQNDVHTLNDMISLLEPVLDSGNEYHRLTLADALHRRGAISNDPQDFHKVVAILSPLLSKDACPTTRGLTFSALLISDSQGMLAQLEHSKYVVHLTEALDTLSYTLSLDHPFELFPLPVFELVRQWLSYSSLLESDNVKSFSATHLSMIQAGMEALSRIVNLSASIDTRVSALSAWHTVNQRFDRRVTAPADYVGFAVATAFLSGDRLRALEWFEQGRSVLWGQLRQLRDPMVAVKIADAELGEELESLRQELLVSSSRERFNPMLRKEEEEGKHHRRIAQTWKEKVAQARRLPGLENFLLPPPITDLVGAHLPGPVVVINCHRRTDALILLPNARSSERIMHVHLEKFSDAAARKWHQQLSLATQGDFAYRTSNPPQYRKGFLSETHVDQVTVFRDMLHALWQDIVYPVLVQLKISVCDNEPRTKIYWCPTGELAFLPIHAAGDYTKTEKGHKIFEYVVSSYTPSVSALLQRDSPTMRPTSTLAKRLLAVSVADADGQASIPYTDEEISRIEARVDRDCEVTVLKGHSATKTDVTIAMRNAAWAHFACHGVQNTVHPMESALLLSGSDRLCLTDIASLDLRHAELAFLSACQTATGINSLPSESMHLAAGMLLAGFRSVVATLWSIKDRHAPQVAADVYAALLKRDKEDAEEGSQDVGTALHKAAMKLRDEVGNDDFLAWVPYVHLGL